MSNKFEWWGYLHSLGSIQAKRYFGTEDIKEANESPFCAQVFGPFLAEDREDALKQIKKLIK